MSEKTSIDPAVMRSLWVVMVGGLAVLFDTTIVSVALHTLARDLAVPVATIQWVSTAYLLALAATVPLVGWAQRVFGTKRLWMGALTLFLAGSVASSLAWSAGSLIAFRVVQGVGGGILMPLMATIVMQAAGGQKIGRIMSIVSLPAALGPVLGPVVGGLILNHLAWPWLFWVNVPFAVAGLILAARLLPHDGPLTRVRLDAVGFVLMAAGLVGILFGLSNAGSDGGFSRVDVLVPVVVGVGMLVGFVFWSIAHGSTALLDVRLLKHRALASASGLLFLAGLTLYGAMLLVPLYFQTLRGASPLEAGLLLIPQGLGTFVVRSFVGRLSDSVSSRLLVMVGFVIVLIGTVPFALADADTSYVWLLIVLFVRGAGLGTVTMPLMALGYRGLTREEVPEASIIVRAGQQVGGSFGTAVLAVVLTMGFDSAGSTAAGFQHGFWWAAGFTALGILLSILLPGRVPRVSPPASEGEESPQSDRVHLSSGR